MLKVRVKYTVKFAQTYEQDILVPRKLYNEQAVEYMSDAKLIEELKKHGFHPSFEWPIPNIMIDEVREIDKPVQIEGITYIGEANGG